MKITLLFPLLIFLSSCIQQQLPLSDDTTVASSTQEVSHPFYIVNGSVEVTNSGKINIEFLSNGNSDNVITATLYTCALDSNFGCDPTAGTVTTLNDVSGKLTRRSYLTSLTLSSLSLTNTSYINYKLILRDSSSLIKFSRSGWLQLPENKSEFKSINQLNPLNIAVNYTHTDGKEDVREVVELSNGDKIVVATSTSQLRSPTLDQTTLVLIKLDKNGNLVSSFGDSGIKQFGIDELTALPSFNSTQYSLPVAYDSINKMIYIAGTTSESLGGSLSGSSDMLIMKISAETGELDLNFGSDDGQSADGILQLNDFYVGDSTGSYYDSIFSMVFVDSSLLVAGRSDSPFNGPALIASYRPFILKMDDTGSLDTSFGIDDGNDHDGILLLNQTKLGSEVNSSIYHLSITPDNQIFAAMEANGSLGGTAGGSNDIVLGKFYLTTGKTITAFGSGDGQNNDGLFQFNDSHAGTASGYEKPKKVIFDRSSSSYFLLGAVSYLISPSSSFGGGTYTTMSFYRQEKSFVIKGNYFTGAPDASSGIGSGDGQDSDGILHLGPELSNDQDYAEFIYDIDFNRSRSHLLLTGSTTGSFGGDRSGDSDIIMIKISKSDLSLDTSFGSGDGVDNDGIKQFNEDINSTPLSGNDYGVALILTPLGMDLFAHTTTNFNSYDSMNSYDLATFHLHDNADYHESKAISQISFNNKRSSDSLTYTIDSWFLEYDSVMDSSGNIFVIGETQSSNFGGEKTGNRDVYILKFNRKGYLDTNFGSGDGKDNDGILQFNKNVVIDSSESEYGRSFALDESNQLLYFSMQGSASLGGTNQYSKSSVNIGRIDLITQKLDTTFGNGDGRDSDGLLQFNDSILPDSDFSISGVSITFGASTSDLYIAGVTSGDFGGTSAGGNDVFVIKLDVENEILDTSFGGGDGISLLSASNLSADEHVNKIVFDGTNSLYLSGGTASHASGASTFCGGTRDGIIYKVNATTGALDTDFGDNDGNDNDGVLHFSDTLVKKCNKYDAIEGLYFDSSNNKLYATFFTQSALGGTFEDSWDSGVIKINPVDGDLDSTFGSGDGEDSDGIIQFNSLFGIDATGQQQYSGPPKPDGNGNLLLFGYSNSNISVIKIKEATGAADITFGSGDGNDNDGHFFFNSTNPYISDSTRFDRNRNGGHIDPINGDLIMAAEVESSYDGVRVNEGVPTFFRLDPTTGQPTTP